MKKTILALVFIIIVVFLPGCESTTGSEGVIVKTNSVSTGFDHTCEIKGVEKNLYCWGSNYYGQLGDGTFEDRTMPVKIGNDSWLHISAGKSYTCGIKESGRVLYCWGKNQYGQLGDGTTEDKNIPVKIGDIEWLKVSAGFTHSCGIDKNNHLYCWGRNNNGQIGDGTKTIDGLDAVFKSPVEGVDNDRREPVKIGDALWLDVIPYFSITLGIKTNNEFFQWGGVNFSPVRSGKDLWIDISAGYFHFCGINKTDKKLYCRGGNDYGQVGDGTTDQSAEFKKISDKEWTGISTGIYHNCGITEPDGKLYCWGLNDFGQIGIGTVENALIPVLVNDDEWSEVSASPNGSCARKRLDGSLYCWGNNYAGQLGNGFSGDLKSPQKIIDGEWSDISTGVFHSCGIKNTDSSLYCWGNNSNGFLQSSSDSYINTPVKINDEKWLKIAAGFIFNCGINSDNFLYCWGSNTYGQLGNGEFGAELFSSEPVKIGESEWVDIAAADETVCGIMKNSLELYCWGNNALGNAGVGYAGGNGISSPQTTGAKSWNSLSLGREHSCAIEQDTDIAFCWGWNSCGELGDWTAGNQTVPYKANDYEWLKISSGTGYTCGIKKSDSSLYCWGNNSAGQLGNDVEIVCGYDDDPVYISIEEFKTGDDEWMDVSAGADHVCGINKEKDLYCWGVNINGAIGDGTRINRIVPVKIGNEKWKKVSAARDHTCGIKLSDNGLYCWGSNYYGQIANPKGWETSPVPVLSAE